MMTTKRTILVVDDEKTMRDFLCTSLQSEFLVHAASGATEAMSILQKVKVDLVLSDMQMPGRDGMELLSDIRQTLKQQPLVIMMTAFGSIELALEATRNGAQDFLTKPFGMDQLGHAIQRAFEFSILKRENSSLRSHVAVRSQHKGLLGANPAMVQLREKIAMIADSKGTVLLQGESGTGKEVVARAIHETGNRRDGPFIRINCAAIPETLLESELFGYERGAFTGAVSARMGKFELADGGTLLLDEISEMPFAMQAKLLRVLQEREFMRLGAKYATKADVRIIATTNRNLREAIKEHHFREDLYYRLNVIPLRVTPLRLRKDDIPMLAAHFCQNFCAENNKPLLEISEAAMRSLLAMDWPGNVRQLQNVIERAVILSTDDYLDQEILGLSEEIDVTEKASNLTQDMTLKDMERELIMRKLECTQGNRTRAASELGISVRTLRNKLNLYTDMGLEIPR